MNQQETNKCQFLVFFKLFGRCWQKLDWLKKKEFVFYLSVNSCPFNEGSNTNCTQYAVTSPFCLFMAVQMTNCQKAWNMFLSKLHLLSLWHENCFFINCTLNTWFFRIFIVNKCTKYIKFSNNFSNSYNTSHYVECYHCIKINNNKLSVLNSFSLLCDHPPTLILFIVALKFFLNCYVVSCSIIDTFLLNDSKSWNIWILQFHPFWPKLVQKWTSFALKWMPCSFATDIWCSQMHVFWHRNRDSL